MNEGFTESVVGRTRALFRVALENLGNHSADRLRDSISVPVVRHAGHVIRSLPGEPPRKEFGDLYNSVAVSIETDSDGPMTDAVVVEELDEKAGWLEHGTSRILPRPHIQPERDRLYPEAVEFLAGQMADL